MWYKCLVGHKMQYFVIIERKSNARRVVDKKKRIKESKWGYGGLNFLYFFLRCKHNKIFRLYGRLNGKGICIWTGDFVICLGGYVGDLNKKKYKKNYINPYFYF